MYPHLLTLTMYKEDSSRLHRIALSLKKELTAVIVQEAGLTWSPAAGLHFLPLPIIEPGTIPTELFRLPIFHKTLSYDASSPKLFHVTKFVAVSGTLFTAVISCTEC
jgi:hypothetical protein